MQKRYDLIQLELLLVSLMEKKKPSLNELASCFKKISIALERLEKSSKLITPTFKNDLEALKQAVLDRLQDHKKEARLKSWKVVETDNWEDLLLSGTEVLGSCQNVHGSPELNKCLLGYLLDGKNRLLAVKDEEGKIRARAVLRLLLSKSPPVIDQNLPPAVQLALLAAAQDLPAKPVLFLERVYPDAAETSLQAALLEGAKEKARQLGVDLYTKEFKAASTPTSDDLISKGSPAPFEYVDAAGGIIEKNNFTIEKALKISY